MARGSSLPRPMGIMISVDCVDDREIQIGNAAIETTEELCCLGSYVTSDSSCDKDCQTNLQSQQRIWKIDIGMVWYGRTGISTTLKVRLYELLMMSTVLHGAELWTLTVAQKKKLEATHHEFQRRMMGIYAWKDKVSNERVGVQTQLEKIDHIIKDTRLRWLGHVLRMDDNGLPRQAGYKRYKEKAWKTTKELDRHHTTRFEKHWHDLGSSAYFCIYAMMNLIVNPQFW